MISITPADFDRNAAEVVLREILDEYNSERVKYGAASKFCPAVNVLDKRTGPVQLIPEDQWTNIQPFIEHTVENLCHPHHRILCHRILSNYKRDSDVLLVANCGITKPYSKTRQHEIYNRLAKKGWFDLCIMSFHPVPLVPVDASTMYPNTVYDWHHLESKMMQHHDAQFNFSQWVEFLKRAGYKKVIFCLTLYEGYNEVYHRLKEALPNIEMTLLLEDYPPVKAFIKERFKGTGVWVSRIHSFRVTREFIAQCLGNPAQFRRDAKLPL